MRVLCVTPNPAIDRTLRVSGFAAGGVWRAESVDAVCGGKGVNVARMITALGHQATCAGPLGGHSGRLAAELARREALDHAWTWIPGETRMCLIIVGSGGADGGETSVINEPGPPVSPADWWRLVADVAAAARDADAVCICGSFPPGVPEGSGGALIAAARSSGSPVWVDTSGAPLAEAVAAAPDGIKINGDEAAALLGQPVETPEQAATAAQAGRARGAATAVITLGRRGAVMATAHGCWRGQVPAVDSVSAVGSGDAFLAGIISGLGARASPAVALRLAVACGAANALQPVARIDPADVSRLLPLCRVDRFSGQMDR